MYGEICGRCDGDMSRFGRGQREHLQRLARHREHLEASASRLCREEAAVGDDATGWLLELARPATLATYVTHSLA